MTDVSRRLAQKPSTDIVTGNKPRITVTFATQMCGVRTCRNKRVMQTRAKGQTSVPRSFVMQYKAWPGYFILPGVVKVDAFTDMLIYLTLRV